MNPQTKSDVLFEVWDTLGAIRAGAGSWEPPCGAKLSYWKLAKILALTVYFCSCSMGGAPDSSDNNSRLEEIPSPEQCEAKLVTGPAAELQHCTKTYKNLETGDMPAGSTKRAVREAVQSEREWACALGERDHVTHVYIEEKVTDCSEGEEVDNVSEALEGKRSVCMSLKAGFYNCTGSRAHRTTSKVERADDDHGYSDTDGGHVVLEIWKPEAGSVEDPHYAFANNVLPEAVLMNRETEVQKQFLKASPERYLRLQWDALHDVEPEVYPSSVPVYFDGNTEAILIEMPPPQDQGHAHFVLVTFADSGIEYFILEHNIFLRDEPYTDIGGWVMNDPPKHLRFPKHVEYGVRLGPTPEKETFIENVQQLVE